MLFCPKQNCQSRAKKKCHVNLSYGHKERESFKRCVFLICVSMFSAFGASFTSFRVISKSFFKEVLKCAVLVAYSADSPNTMYSDAVWTVPELYRTEIISSQGLSLGAVPFVCKTAWNCASAVSGAQWRRAKCSCRFVQLLPHRDEKVSFLRWHKCYGTAAFET